MSLSRRLSPVWFIAAMFATFAVVTAIAWLVHGNEGPPSTDSTPPGELPVLSVAEVLSDDELPLATATVVGRLDAIVAPVGDAPPALVLSREDGTGELLVVPAPGTPIAPTVLRAAAGTRVRAVGQLRIATSTNPPRRGGEGELSAESLGEPVLYATQITLARARLRGDSERQPGSRSAAAP